MTSTSGRTLWPTGPTDPEIAPCLAAEARALTRRLHEAARLRAEVEADECMAALLATLED